jgi:hypothetical protein
LILSFFDVAHLWRNRQKRATTYRSELTKLTVEISHHVATSLYVPIPSKTTLSQLYGRSQVSPFVANRRLL